VIHREKRERVSSQTISLREDLKSQGKKNRTKRDGDRQKRSLDGGRNQKKKGEIWNSG